MPLRSMSFLKRRRAAPIGSRSWTRIRKVIRPPFKREAALPHGGRHFDSILGGTGGSSGKGRCRRKKEQHRTQSTPCQHIITDAAGEGSDFPAERAGAGLPPA